jgi:thiosulfate/3-mercaptopyruvate sulfurtransferase
VADYAKDVLAEPDWLEQHLNDDSIRIVEVDENPALYRRAYYREAHIPGAIGFDWKLELQDQVRRDFLAPEEFHRLFGSRGISNEHQIILYGDRNNWFAAYAYWYLKYYGHENVKLLNGPRERWISEGRPVTAAHPHFAPAIFDVRTGDGSIRATREEVLGALDGSHVLIDVRSPQEYSGALVTAPGYEAEGAQRGGHIPGAKSIPWSRAVTEDGAFRSADELDELYGARGALDGKPIITYCRIGERSAHTWFVLHELLGVPEVKNYDGSWAEWGNMIGVPIAKGTQDT